jgi:hypothetical protein
MLKPLTDDRRSMARCRVAQTVRVRPSSPLRGDFDDLARTLNASRTGMYFKAWRRTYYKGMRLFVSYPYSEVPGALNKDFIARVVRIDPLADGRSAIAVELLLPFYLESFQAPL